MTNYPTMVTIWPSKYTDAQYKDRGNTNTRRLDSITFLSKKDCLPGERLTIRSVNNSDSDSYSKSDEFGHLVYIPMPLMAISSQSS